MGDIVKEQEGRVLGSRQRPGHSSRLDLILSPKDYCSYAGFEAGGDMISFYLHLMQVSTCMPVGV